MVGLAQLFMGIVLAFLACFGCVFLFIGALHIWLGLVWLVGELTLPFRLLWERLTARREAPPSAAD
jgi:hypothetical protein